MVQPLERFLNNLPPPDFRDFYSPGGLEGKIILDPMMGGGTTLHEAIRLGASVIGADIDPIPLVQLRASLSALPVDLLQQEFDSFFSAVRKASGTYYLTTCPTCTTLVDSTFVLHGVRKKCACSDEWLQVDRYVLREEEGSVTYIHPTTLDIETAPSLPDFENSGRLITKDVKKCPACGEQLSDMLELPYYQRMIPIAVFGNCAAHGTFIKRPDAADKQLIDQANAERPTVFDSDDFRVMDGPKTRDLLRRDINRYSDLFSSRQLLFLEAAIGELQAARYASRLHLALLLSTSLEFNSLLSGYKGWQKRRAGAIRHVFSLHAYSFPYTVLENNPVNVVRSSGNLQQIFQDRIKRARLWAQNPVERVIRANGTTTIIVIEGESDSGYEVNGFAALTRSDRNFWLIHGSSAQLPVDDRVVDYVVTDPPYFDSIQYSNLAAFFRVWLQRIIPNEINWTYDEAESAVANSIVDPTHYCDVLSAIFSECGRVLKPSGRMVFTYHHWDPDAWADLTIALKRAGFFLINSYVVLSEHPISVHINNLDSLKHDSILVLGLATATLPEVSWSSLVRIDTTDSEVYSRDCAATLGWLLGQDNDEAQIRALWKELISK